jgi:exopolysaccharide biosynthesis polyprenyl glycosylphosphotransferase
MASQTRNAWSSLSPGFTSKANVVVDAVIVVTAVSVPLLQDRMFDLAVRPWMASVAIALVTWIVTSSALRQYSAFGYDRSYGNEIAMLGVLSFAVVTTLTVLDALLPEGTRVPQIKPMLEILFFGTLLVRLLVFRHLSVREEAVDEVVIIGVGAIGRVTAQEMVRRGRRRIAGFLSFADENHGDVSLLARAGVASVLGGVADLDSVLRSIPLCEVYIAGNVQRHAKEMQEAIRVCERLGMPFALPAYTFRLERAQVVEQKPIADGYLHYQQGESKPEQRALKRLFDVVASTLALWLLLPIFVGVMLLIKLTSRGPIFFRQERVGLHGRRFHMLKFRSMVINAEALKKELSARNELTGPVFKMKNDPRVTRVGRFIRKYSIDELPQLINVLRGDMSVVGPRPPVPAEVARYEAWQRRRLSVRPGLTCIWQVSGRNQISFEDWMYLDMQYIDNWSLARDFNLIFRTVPVVITGRGAS